jgi:hypothetical protein
MNKKILNPGTWVKVDPGYGMSLIDVRHTVNCNRIAIVQETEGRFSTGEKRLIVFDAKGTFIGVDDAHPKHLTPIKPPSFAKHIQFLPVAWIEVYPGIYDNRTKRIYATDGDGNAPISSLTKKIKTIKKIDTSKLLK